MSFMLDVDLKKMTHVIFSHFYEPHVTVRNVHVILSNLRVSGPNILANHTLMRQFLKNRIGYSIGDRVCLGATRLIGHYC